MSPALHSPGPIGAHVTALLPVCMCSFREAQPPAFTPLQNALLRAFPFITTLLRPLTSAKPAAASCSREYMSPSLGSHN